MFIAIYQRTCTGTAHYKILILLKRQSTKKDPAVAVFLCLLHSICCQNMNGSKHKEFHYIPNFGEIGTVICIIIPHTILLCHVAALLQRNSWIKWFEKRKKNYRCKWCSIFNSIFVIKGLAVQLVCIYVFFHRKLLVRFQSLERFPIFPKYFRAIDVLQNGMMDGWITLVWLSPKTL